MRQSPQNEKATRGRGGSSSSSQALQLATPARQRGRTGPPATRKPREKVVVGLNFGSSALSAALTVGNGKPQKIPLGMIHGLGGRLTKEYKRPTLTKFLESKKFETLGHQPVTDFGTTSSGAKQSLDSRLCQPGSEGAMFVDLCERYDVRKEDVIIKLLADALPYIEDFIKEKLGTETLSTTDWMVTIGVPAIWTDDKLGQGIQETLVQCLVDAGYPGEAGGVRCDQESGLTYAYLRYEGRIKVQQHIRINDQELFIDVGASTTDCTPRVSWYKHTLLAGEPAGCGGGMANFWRWLHCECRKKNPDITFFDSAQAFVYSLGPATGDEDFVRGSHTMRVDDIKSKILECFEGPINLVQYLIRKMPNIREVIVSGESPTSNNFIKNMWETAIRDALAEIRRPNCLITFVDSEDASLAVCMGAAMPYDEDPRSRFKRWCFGFKCHQCQLKGKCPDEKRCKDGKSYIDELKPRKSMKIADWVPLSTDDLEEGVLTIEPHMVVAGDPWQSLVSKDTKHQIWPTNHAVSMNPVTVTLQPSPEPGTEIWMRFRVDDSSSIEPEGDFSLEDPPRLIFEVCFSSGAEKIRASVTLGLSADRDRLLFLERARRVETELVRAGQSTSSVEEDCHEDRPLEQPRGSSVWEFQETPPPPAHSASPATTVKQKRRTNLSKTRNRRKKHRNGSVDLGTTSGEMAVDQTIVASDGEDPETRQSTQPESSSREFLDSERVEDSAGASTTNFPAFWNVVGSLRPKNTGNADIVRVG